MKSYFRLFILILTLVLINSYEKSLLSSKAKIKNRNKKISDIHGETYNVDDNPGTFAIAYAPAKIREPRNLENLIVPQTVSKISDEPPKPVQGPLEEIVENPTVGEYYDGSIKLNTVKVNCKIFTSVSDCIHHSNCGWCGSKNGCVLGNNFGPFEKCVRSSYIFSNSVASEHNIRSIVEPVGGFTHSVISSNLS